jgi:hypothetical protein
MGGDEQPAAASAASNARTHALSLMVALGKKNFHETWRFAAA